MLQKQANRLARKARVRSQISGTAQRPRLSIFRSATHIYAQIIDDEAGKTLCAASDLKITDKLTEGSTTDFKVYLQHPANQVLEELCLAGMPPVKWSTWWDRNIPISGGPENGRKERQARRDRVEVTAS